MDVTRDVLWGYAASHDGSESEAWACFTQFAEAVEQHLAVDGFIALCEEGLRAVERELYLRIRTAGVFIEWHEL